MSTRDPSFSTFLSKRAIDPTDPFANDQLTSKRIFLKYKLDAVYRTIFYKRTRRNPPIHYGLPYIFDICDGNPRLVIGLVDEIIRRSITVGQQLDNIPKNLQSQIIYNASIKQFNLIQNHPDATIAVTNAELNLANDILEPIGNFIHDKIIQEGFSVTSPSTFIIDEGINHKYVNLLELALYLGAIVYLDPIESLSHTGILGKRFRLSNFLTPAFKIPSRVFSQVNLSTIVSVEKRKKQTKLGL